MNESITSINNTAFFERLADIEPPAEPALWPLFVIGLAICIAIAALLLWGYLRYSDKKPQPVREPSLAQQATARLAAIEAAWQLGEIDARETAYRLSTVLRLGLGLPQLSEQCPQLLTEERKQWQQTIKLFEQLRYKPTTGQQLPEEIFTQLHHWLTISNSGEQRV